MTTVDKLLFGDGLHEAGVTFGVLVPAESLPVECMI